MMGEQRRPTPEDLVQSRIKANEEDAAGLKAARVRVQSALDELIEDLKINRENIGGFAIVYVAQPGQNLVSVNDAVASSGVSRGETEDEALAALLALKGAQFIEHMKDRAQGREITILRLG